MSGTEMLDPGAVVPKTGKYKCVYCGEGGIADFYAKLFTQSGRVVVDASQYSVQSTVQFFEAATTFPECPTCGRHTVWMRVDPPKKPWWRFW